MPSNCNVSSAADLIWALRNRCCVLLFILLYLIPLSLAQRTARKAPPEPRKLPQITSELRARIHDLEAAKQSGNATAILSASRRASALALRELGKTKLERSAPLEAADVIRRSVDFEDIPEAHVDLAIACLLAGKTDEAMAQATNVVVENPQDARAWRIQGRVWMSKRNFDRAVESLKRSAELERDPYTSYLLGFSLLQRKKLEQANTVFKSGFRRKNSAVLHALLSDAYREANYRDEAVRELRQALLLDPKTSCAHYRQAVLAMSRNEWVITAGVRTELLKEVQLNPREFLGNYALGLVEFFDENYSQATPHLLRAAAARPAWPEPWLYLGLAAYGSGDPKGAEGHLRKAIDLTHDDSRGKYQIRRAYFTLSRLLTEQNRKDQAAEFVRRFRQVQAQMQLDTQLMPDSMGGGMAQANPATSAFSTLVRMETELSNFVPAMGNQSFPFDAATMVESGSEIESGKAKEDELRKIVSAALNDLGAAEAREEQFALALAHFHEAERWHADTPSLMRNIGMAAARTSDHKEAVRALRPVVAANPGDSVARSMLALALFMTDAYREATEAFAPLGDSVVEHPELAYAWAASLVKTNRYSQAGTLLDKLQQRQLPPETLILVAQTWSQMGDYSKTVEACHKALAAEPKLPRAHYIAGLALIRQDRPEDAAGEFRSELQLNPENVDAQFHLAFVLLQLSQNEEAMRWLESVLANNPEHPEANYEVGKELMSRGKSGDAIPYLEAAARLRPQFEPVHYQLQSAYRAAGRKEDADREARIYKELKAKSRNITLPPLREPGSDVKSADNP